MIKSMTYREAGVDIAAGNWLAKRLKQLAKSTLRAEVVSGIGGFAGISAIPPGLNDPLLVSGTDGVGTKLKIAFATGKHETVGIDLVAMCVNDILTVGAEPLFFLDYFAAGKLQPDLAEAVVSGVVRGCQQAGCALIGGETAEMPGMYPEGEYELVGFAVGVVERDQVIDGKRVQQGDKVIGLPSSGLHSNGYSLARKVLLVDSRTLETVPPEIGRSLGDELLEPTRIYAPEIKCLQGAAVQINALSHITGGGLVDNPPRSIAEDLAFKLETKTWQVPKVMELIARQGRVSLDEMRRTFNMGLGLLIVVPEGAADKALEVLGSENARLVGEIVPRKDHAVEFV